MSSPHALRRARLPTRLLLPALVAGVLAATGCRRSAEDWLSDATEALREGRYERAKESLTRGLAGREKDPAAAESYNQLGLACWKLDDLASADAAFRRSLTLDPSLFAPCYNLGVLFCRRGAFNEGSTLLSHAADLDPQDTLALEYLASEHLARGQTAEAQALLMRALARSPEDPRVLTALAVSGLASEGPAYAASFLKKALQVSPAYAPALYNLGRVYAVGLQDPTTARPYLRRFLDQPAGSDAVRRDAAELVARAETDPSALPPPPLPNTAEAARNPIQALLDKARTAAGAGQLTTALSLCMDAANQATAAGQDDLALSAIQAAVTLCADQPRAHFAAGRWYTSRGRHADALKAYRQAGQLDASWTAAHRAAAAAAIECGDFQQALEALRQAVRSDPTNADAMWALAQFYDVRLQVADHARAAYQKFIASFPADRRVAEARARISALGG